MALRPTQADQRSPVNDIDVAEAPPPHAPAPHAPAPQTHPQIQPPASSTTSPVTAPAAPKRGGVWRLALMGAALVGLAFAGNSLLNWWTVGRFMETTDDAYVDADITILTAQASGYLMTIEARDNQEVKAGDVIARIDDGDYVLALELARARVDTQRGTVVRTERQVIAANAAVAQAKAQLDSAVAERVRADADFDRQQRLAKSDFASRSAVDEARAARDHAVAAVASAKAAVAQAEANVGVAIAQEDEARRLVKELETQVRKAERDLSFTVVRAPRDGVIGNKAMEVGTRVEPGKRLAALIPLTSVHIEANLKETQLADVRPGQPVHVKVDSRPEDAFIGHVVSVAPASGSVFSLLPPENATGNFTKVVQRVPVWVSVPPEVAERRWLRPGMSVEVSIDTRGDKGGAAESAAGERGVR